MTLIKFDKIAYKLHCKNMMDLNTYVCGNFRMRKINFTVGVKIVKLLN